MSAICSSMTCREPVRAWRHRLWTPVQALLMPMIPSPAYRARRAVLRFFGATLDPHARIRGGVRISHPWNLTVGRKSSIGEGAHVFNPAPLVIGQRSVISQFCYITCAANTHPDRTDPQRPAPIRVHDDVWIAAECVVEGNTDIPSGVLVGARSVISPGTELECWTIATGHPARSRRDRPYNGVKS